MIHSIALSVQIRVDSTDAPWLSKDIILAIIVLPSSSSSTPASSACRNLVHYHASAWFEATQSGQHTGSKTTGGAAVPRLGAVSIALALDVAPGVAFDRVSLNPVGQV